MCLYTKRCLPTTKETVSVTLGFLFPVKPLVIFPKSNTNILQFGLIQRFTYHLSQLFIFVTNLNSAERNRKLVTLSYLLLPTSLISCRNIPKRAEAALSVFSDDKFDPVECNNTGFVRYCAAGQNYTRINYSTIIYHILLAMLGRHGSARICALIGGRWLGLPAADVFQHIIYVLSESVLGADVIISD